MIAVLAVGISQVPGGRERAGRYDLSLLLGASAFVTFLFWLFGTWQKPWELYALYVWTGSWAASPCCSSTWSSATSTP